MRAGGRSPALGDVCWRQIASISPPCPQVDCNAYYFHLIKTYLAGPRREENNCAFVLPRSPVGRSVLLAGRRRTGCVCQLPLCPLCGHSG